jgi:predicted permease
MRPEHWLFTIPLRLRSLFRWGQADQELDDELSDHLERKTEEYVAKGMAPEEARRRARLDLGGIEQTKEKCRDARGVNWIQDLIQDLRYGLRMLRKSPGFTAVAVVTLALGIGANVAIFTVVRAVLLKPLPFSHPEQVVRVYDDLRGANTRDVRMSLPEFWDLGQKSGVFQDISVTFPGDANLTGSEHPDRLQFFGVSPGYFTMMGVQAELGRVFTRNDAQPGFTQGIVISDAFWRRSFAADPLIIDRKIRLDDDLYSIMGVLPPGFRHPGRTMGNDVDVFMAAGYSANPFPTPPQRALRFLPGAVARLQPGLTLAQAQARLDAFTAELTKQFPVEYPAVANWGLRLVPVQDDLVGNVRTELLVLLGAVGCVLLIACVNSANLLLARSASRQREIAVRHALGAGRRRLLAQLLTESLLLSSVSGAVALATVVGLKGWLLRLAPADLPRLNEVSLSPGVLAFAFAVSLVTGVMFGLVPALQTVRPSQIAQLREGSRGTGSSKHQVSVSRSLVASEIAVSLVLLIGAGLLLRSFWQLLDERPGFEPHHLITARSCLPVPSDPDKAHYSTVEKRAVFHEEVLRRENAIPGVQAAALGSGTSLPLGDLRVQLRFMIENQPVDSEAIPVGNVSSVSVGFFEVLGTPLVQGRAFTPSDDSKGQKVTIINEALARKYWANGDALGQHIQIERSRWIGTAPSWLTIVGIVADTRADGLDVTPAPHIFLPMSQVPSYDFVVYLRTALASGTVADSVRREVQSVDPTLPVFAVRPMEEVMAKYLAQRRFALQLLGGFAVLALLLASIGIYGVMAYTFSRRINEIGIRMAMGAQRTDILKMAVEEGAFMVGIGLAAGLAGALALTRLLQSLLFAVKPADPLTFFAISFLLAAVTLAACFFPSWRATRVDPLVALRHE